MPRLRVALDDAIEAMEELEDDELIEAYDEDDDEDDDDDEYYAEDEDLDDDDEDDDEYFAEDDEDDDEDEEIEIDEIDIEDDDDEDDEEDDVEACMDASVEDILRTARRIKRAEEELGDETDALHVASKRIMRMASDTPNPVVGHELRRLAKRIRARAE